VGWSCGILLFYGGPGILRKVMKQLFEVINQLCSLENKLGEQEEFKRYFSRCRQSFEEMGISYYVPLNEKYTDTRTDIEASITGSENGNLFISQVIKPVIVKDGVIVQKGIAIVESGN
jgi:hypothetical protein